MEEGETEKSNKKKEIQNRQIWKHTHTHNRSTVITVCLCDYCLNVNNY